jgi:hypothetical protein
MKKILVNGCSFSRGPNSWPYFIEKRFNVSMVNLAQAAAGNLYIHNSTIAEIAQRDYDTVLIMWSGIERVDCQVSDINFFNKTPYTSYTQSQLNDWPEKIIFPVNDQDYVEKNWVFACNNADKFLKDIKFCETQFKYMNLEHHITQTLIHMVSLQSFLESRKIKFVFMIYTDYFNLLAKNNLFKLLKPINFFIEDNINNIAIRNNWLAEDRCHPSAEAHEHWGNLLSNWLVKNEY